MTNSIASLVLAIDTTQSTKAGIDLDKLTASGERTEAQFNKTGQAASGWQQNMRGVDAAMKSTAERSIELSQATQRIIDNYNPLGAKLRALQADMAIFQREMGNSTHDAAMKTFQGLEDEIAKTGKLMSTAGVAGFEDMANSADRGAFATAGAKRELMVLGHEALTGNFSRMPGSFMVLAERMDLTKMLMSPVTLGVIGIGVAAVGTLVHIYKMSSAIDEFNKSLILTNNYSGQTRDSIGSMAHAIESSATGGIGKANEMLAGLAATGHFTGGEMEYVGRAALKFSELSGESSDKVIKQFDGMRSGVAEWALKSNESYHFLSAAQYEEIHVLELQGDKQLAVMETMRLMNASLDEQRKHLGLWASVVDGASISWGYLNEVMRKTIFPTVGESAQAEFTKLLAMKKELADSDASYASSPGRHDDLVKRIQEQQTLVSGLAKKFSDEEIAAGRKQTLDMANDKGAAAQKEIDALLKNQRSKIEIAADEAKAIRKQFDDINKSARANGKLDTYSQSEIDVAVANNNDRYKDKTHARKDASALLGRDIEAVRKEGADIVDAYTNSQKLIEAVHAAGLMDEQSYYGSTVAILALEGQAKQDELVKELTLLGTAQTARNISGEELFKNQKAIMEAEAKLQKVIVDSQGSINAAGVKHDATVNKMAHAYTDAQAAAQKFIDTAMLAHSRTLGGMGLGNEARSNLSGRYQIEDQYQTQTAANEKFRTDNSNATTGMFNNSDAKQKYGELVALNDTTNAKLLDSYATYLKNKKALESKGDLGAKDALNNYLDETRNVYKQAGDLVSKSFKGMEDALTNFVMTGKLDFSSLSNSIIADMVRMQIQQSITGPLASMALGWMTGGVSTAVSAATGSTPFVADYSLGSSSGGLGLKLPSYDVGTDYVPNDMIAQIHKGERILTAAQNKPGASGNAQPAQNITVNYNMTVGDVASVSMVRQAVAGSEKRIAAGIGRSMQYGGAMDS